MIAIVVLICLIGGSTGYVLLGKGSGSDNDEFEYEEGYPKTVEDFFGNQVTFNESPKRIVASGMEYLVYLGPEVTNRVIWSSSKGISSTNADPMFEVFDELTGILTVGGLTSMAEEVISKKPDLVLVSDARTSEKDRIEFKETLNEVGINVFFYTAQGRLFSDARGSIEINLTPIAKIFNMEDRVTELLDFIDLKTEELMERMAEVDKTVTRNVYVAGGVCISERKFLTTSADAHFPLAYFDDYLHNVMKDIDSSVLYKDISFEDLYEFEDTVDKIDYVLIDQGCWTDFRNEWNADSSRFKAIEAFKNDQVYYVIDWMPRSTNPLISAYCIGALLFPEQFADFEIKGLIEEIYNLFYGFEGAGAEAYEVLVNKTNLAFGQDVEIFGKVDFTKL